MGHAREILAARSRFGQVSRSFPLTRALERALPIAVTVLVVIALNVLTWVLDRSSPVSFPKQYVFLDSGYNSLVVNPPRVPDPCNISAQVTVRPSHSATSITVDWIDPRSPLTIRLPWTDSAYSVGVLTTTSCNPVHRLFPVEMQFNTFIETEHGYPNQQSGQ